MNAIRIAAVAAVVGISAQIAVADQWTKQTKVTFSRAVEVPGAVLPAGTYMFKLQDSSSNRHVVHVQNVRETKPTPPYSRSLTTASTRAAGP